MLASQYYAGNRVVVFFEDTGWEPGTVISVKPPGIKISFDDGTEGIHNPEIDAVRIDEVCPDKLKECARRVELGHAEAAVRAAVDDDVARRLQGRGAPAEVGEALHLCEQSSARGAMHSP